MANNWLFSSFLDKNALFFIFPKLQWINTVVSTQLVSEFGIVNPASKDTFTTGGQVKMKPDSI
ncbi:hypothetical protein [uncultured Gammaproteobacteria bacterium]|nr:hypothetical protein BROOK1789B_1591 [Bathymodiolus brooksi thiotrophic gill symbiont]CAC9611391.1 hypothetical protein [uncultured Gammaproteobacteria bacterium]CAC9958243.1 hypothetical protein [uncultured Gammaproteobacteria bacterium]